MKILWHCITLLPFLVKRKTINHLPRLQALEKKKRLIKKQYFILCGWWISRYLNEGSFLQDNYNEGIIGSAKCRHRNRGRGEFSQKFLKTKNKNTFIIYHKCTQPLSIIKIQTYSHFTIYTNVVIHNFWMEISTFESIWITVQLIFIWKVLNQVNVLDY